MKNSNMDKEPSLDKIDDYRGTESKEKRNIIRLVIIFLLAVGALFSYLEYNKQMVDYVGTEEAPGIIINKK